MSYRNAKTTRLLQTGAALVVAAVLMIPVGGPTAAYATVEDDPPAPVETTPAPEPTETPTAAPTPAPTLTAEPLPPDEPAPDESARMQADAQTDVQALAAAPVPSTGRIATSTDPYVASVRASVALFPGRAATAILVPASAPVFAAAAASLAASRGASVLYVQAGAIPSVVLTELRRLAPTSILVVGGTAFISDAVVTTARTVTANVQRLGGANFYETARAIFAQNTAAADVVYLSGAKTLDDLPLATVMGVAKGKRVLAVNGHGAPLDAATVNALRAAGTRTVVIVQSTAPVTAAYETALRAAGFAVSRITRTDRASLSVTVAVEAAIARSASLIVNAERSTDVGIAAVVAGVTAQPLFYSVAECVPDGIVTNTTAAGARLLLIGDAYALTAGVERNAPCSTEKPRLEAALVAAIRSTMAQYAGTYAVTVRQIGGLTQNAQISGGLRLEPASMMKIFAAWAAYKRIEEGRASYSTVLPSGVTLGICVHVMIRASDNYCHSDIVHWIGITELNRMIRAAGFTSTSYGSVPRGTSVLYAGNRTTSNDLALMVERLSTYTVLGKAYADPILAVMRAQIFRSRIPSGIPAGITQASKPGSLWIASGLMQGDTALIIGPTATYSISIIGDDGPPIAALRAISRTVYERLNGAFGAAASYPVQQMATTKPIGLRLSPGGKVSITVGANVPLEVIDANRVWYLVRYGSRQLWVHYSGLRER